MDHRMVAHRWAQMDSKGRAKGFNMYFEGFSIYSYGRHFEIARWVPTLASEKARVERGVPAMCVLFNAGSYSTSTSKHQTYTYCAIPSGIWIFRIPQEFWPIGIADQEVEGFRRKQALQWYETKALEAFEKATRARTYADHYRSEAERILNEAQNFALAFNVKWKRPEMTELREKANKAAKAAMVAAKKAKKEALARQAAKKATDRADFEAWQRGEIHWVPNSWRTADYGFCFVRRHGDNLETSMGATVPWEHAVKVFRFVKLCKERGEGWERNGRTIRVGHFQVDSVTAEGDMIAGCHRFKWDEMRALAEREGVAGFEASDAALEPKS